MNSNEHPPSLSLSDIMHPMSPSPAPVEDPPLDAHHPRYDPDVQQEPLTDSEVLIIRNRLQELGLVMSYGSENEDLPIPRLGVANHLNLREKELTDMILQLTSCPRINTTQLEEQAITISSLTAQRDYLIARAEEERLKLQSERENWNRTAEALLTQKTRPSKPEDTDTRSAAFETEIKLLREKLHDRNRRLSSLEQEILRLKPLLLMQPYSNQRIKQTLASQSQTMKIQDKGKRREVDATPAKVTSLNVIRPQTPQKFNPTTYPYGYQYKPEVSIPSGQSSTSHTFLLEEAPPSGPSSQRRRSKDHSIIQKGKKQKHYRSTTMSDAYAEHVLLAAQRIGRKRASLVTGLQRLADREKDLLAREHDQHRSRDELERLEKERLGRLASGTPSMAYYRPSEDSSPRAASTPTGSKTPKRGGYPFSQHHNANPGGVNTPPPSTYVFVNSSAARIPNIPATYSPGSISNSPSHPDATSSAIRSTNPPTPLDSLVDAARMMGEGGDRNNARRRLLEEPESPTAKRRKVATGKVLVNRGASKLGRVQSGLDVLADQAAAVKKPGQTSTQLSANDSHTVSDRKGKAKANTKATDPEWRMPSKTRSSTRTIRPSSRKLSASHDSLAASMTGRETPRTQGLSRRSDTPEPRVIALPTFLSSGFDASESTRLGLNLRPVMGWGDRPVPEDDEDDSNSDSACDSPTRNDARDEIQGLGLSSTRDPTAVEVNTPLPSAVRPEMGRVPAPSVALGATDQSSDAALANGYDEEKQTPTHHIAGDSLDAAPSALAQSSIRQTLTTDKSEAYQPSLPVENPVSRTPSQEPSRQGTLGPVHAEHGNYAEDEAGADGDEDAEGEEDEENTENDAEMGPRDPSRSRSPPPPDPPGNDDLPGNNQDPDADADGDMDVDDKETPPSGASPATQDGHHQQTVADSIESRCNVAMVFLSPQCRTASLKQLSSCVQHSRVPIHTIVRSVGDCAVPTDKAISSRIFLERDDSICDTEGYCLISKSASIVSH